MHSIDLLGILYNAIFFTHSFQGLNPGEIVKDSEKKLGSKNLPSY